VRYCEREHVCELSSGNNNVNENIVLLNVHCWPEAEPEALAVIGLGKVKACWKKWALR
jgi:hypothetical protein